MVHVCPSPYPLPTKVQIQIMIILVFILSRYWFKSIILFLKMGAPTGYPYAPEGGIIGPEGARKEK